MRCCRTDGFDEELRKTNVFRIGLKANGIGIRKTRDIRHDVVRAPRLEDGEACTGENFQQPFAFGSIRSGKLVVVTRGKVQGAGAGLLKRCSGANGQKIVHFANRLRRLRRRQHPAHAPTGNAVRFRQAIYDDRAIAHSVDARHGNMFRAVVQNVLVDFVGDAVCVPPDAEVADEFEFRAREYLACRI